MNKRKNNVLSYLKKDIQTFITTTDINEINEKISENDCLLINGTPGCGKSALAKEYLKQKDSPILMFKPEDFDVVDNIQFFFNRFNILLS